MHKRHLIHRDLKPDNILLAEFTTPETQEKEVSVKITDFGLTTYGRPGQLPKLPCGTAAFMAPELIVMVGIPYDQRVDVWALGIIAFMLLS